MNTTDLPDLALSGCAIVKGRESRIAWQTRPWLHEDEVISISGEGPFVEMRDEGDLPLGTGILCPTHEKRIRLLSTAHTARPIALLRTRLERAYERRRRDLLGNDGFRLCHSDGDGVPGMYVDLFGDGLLITLDSSDVFFLTEHLVPHLQEITAAKNVVVRHRENPSLGAELLAGDVDDALFHHGRVLMDVDLLSPRLADLPRQLSTQRACRRFSGGQALDLFAGFGGYGLHWAHASSSTVFMVDQNAEMCNAIDKNAKRNGLQEQIETLAANPLDVLKKLDEEGESFETIACMPPLVRESRDGQVEATQRVYDIHRPLFRVAHEGTLLITWSASTAVSDHAFLETVAEAAFRSRKRLQILEKRVSGLDHPEIAGMGLEESVTTFVARVVASA